MASKFNAKQVFTQLCEQGVAILGRHVWNEQQKCKNNGLNDLSPSEALLEPLRNYGIKSGKESQVEVKTQILDGKI